MANRTSDIINLREAARRCRAIAHSSETARGTDYLGLADEIDRMIQSLTASSGGNREQRTIR